MNWYSEIEEILGDFDTLKLNSISKLSLYSVVTNDNYHMLNLDILVSYFPDVLLELKFIEIRQFVLPELVGGPMQFGELIITDIKNQELENMNYRIQDELVEIAFYCRDIEVKNIT